MYLDGAHSVTAYSLISIGSFNFTTLHPREVFQREVLVGAIARVISHNHPSGNDTPSQQDLDIRRAADWNLPACDLYGRTRLLPSLALVRQEPLPPGKNHFAARLTNRLRSAVAGMSPRISGTPICTLAPPISSDFPASPSCVPEMWKDKSTKGSAAIMRIFYL